MSSLTRSLPIALITVLALTPSAGAKNQGLGNTSWQLLQIKNADGTSELTDAQKYTLSFESGGSLVARLNCNRGTGTWKSTSPGQIEIGTMAVTAMACLPPSLDTRMAHDLAAFHTYSIEDGHLKLNLSSGGYYEFAPLAFAGLPNTSWELVEIRNADGTSLRPDDPAKYTFSFEADGSVSARLDCNRGRGTWKSALPGQIELAPMAVTRMMCLSPTLSDRMAKDWSTIHSYEFQDRFLRLITTAGGYYEFQPLIAP